MPEPESEEVSDRLIVGRDLIEADDREAIKDGISQWVIDVINRDRKRRGLPPLAK